MGGQGDRGDVSVIVEVGLVVKDKAGAVWGVLVGGDGRWFSHDTQYYRCWRTMNRR